MSGKTQDDENTPEYKVNPNGYVAMAGMSYYWWNDRLKKARLFSLGKIIYSGYFCITYLRSLKEILKFNMHNSYIEQHAAFDQILMGKRTVIS
jgi:hypothetical protein